MFANLVYIHTNWYTYISTQLLFNHKTSCAITEKSNIQNNQTCNTVITTGMLSEHNATIKHYTMYITEKFTKSMHPTAAV